MVEPAISNVPLTPRIAPAVNDNRSHSSMEDRPTSKQLWIILAELRVTVEKVREMFSSPCVPDPDRTSRNVKGAVEKVDSVLDEVDDHDRRLWQSEVDSWMKDLEALVQDGKKFIGSLRKESRQDDSAVRRYCWYHSRFGGDATNCQPPCDFDKEYNAEGIDGIRDNVDNHSQAAWESDVELCTKDLEALVYDGKKFIGSLRSESRQDDSAARRYCWYHSRFGVDANSCEPPCHFDEEYSFSEWWQRLIEGLCRLSDDVKQMSLHHTQRQSPSRSHHQSRNRSDRRSRNQSTNGSYRSRDRSYRSRDRSYSRSRNQSRNVSGSGSYNRSRNQSPQWSHSTAPNQSRTPSRDRFGPTSPPSFSSSEVMCWYHREFGGSAKRCLSPCEFYDDYCTEYVSNW